jgi:hypothetical protein
VIFQSILRINHCGGWSVVLEATGCWPVLHHGMFLN